MEIPEWLAQHINADCPYCGSPIVNNEALTDRYCSNRQCPEHMAHKIDVLAKRFQIKGFGVASARQTIKQHKLTFHTQIIPIWFKEPPLLYLHEVGEICLFKGHQKKWRDYCNGCDTVMDVLRSGRLPKDITDQAQHLINTQLLCRVKPRLLGERLNVMLSGSFEGYRARSDFITEMNQLYGNYIQLVDVGKRKTQVSFLVKEPYTVDHEKSAIAKANGIAIISPAALKERLAAYCSYVNERRNSE